ncbi:MAG: ATPase protein [Segetibacter sp.]|nr:ATPase protein [Segetibacter sp.]
MKITKLQINDFHQFKNFELDLTYPLGHQKEGQPMDKVCIIGQSGTGKTTLIELLGGLTHNFDLVRDKYKLKSKDATISIYDKDIRYNHEISDKGGYWASDYVKNGENIESKEFLKMYTSYIDAIKPNLIYYPAELKYELTDTNEVIDFKERSVIDFSLENASAIWNLILNDIQVYQEKELAIRQEISRRVENANSNIDAIKDAVKTLEEWKQKSFNPIADLAENCLNPILKRFNLQVKTDLDIKKKDDIGFIKIEDLNKNEIPYGLLSTGTKQVILSALPMYLLKPNQTIICFDEPERSLYPDIQQEVVSYYESLVTNCQMFFATHSPIIASSFEPWEIVELKFNGEGKVYQEKYYDEEKGRHIDNYNIDPNYLTIDLILSKIFDLKETHSYVRNEKITEVLMLRNILEKMKSEDKTNTKKFKDIYKKYQDLASKLSWEFEIPIYAED